MFRRPFAAVQVAESAVQTTESSTISEHTETDKLYKVLELELRGHDSAVLKSFSKFAMTTGEHLEIDCKS